jgi:hypothetical protein
MLRMNLALALIWGTACGGQATDTAHAGGGTRSSSSSNAGTNSSSSGDPYNSGGGSTSGGTTGTNAGRASYDGILALTPTEAEAAFNAACSSLLHESNSCTLALPPVEAGTTIDPLRVDVLYLVNGGGYDVGRMLYSTSNCSSGDGWRLATESTIVLCENTCRAFHLDVHPTILVAVRCD